jgi:hypothetical protein
MAFGKLLIAPIAAALMASGTAAVAGTLTFQGVTFASSSPTPNSLTIEIDAAGRTGDWATAVSMDMIALKDVGTFSGASLLGPGGEWTYSANELNAKGCGGGVSGGVCFSHVPVALADNMTFNFTFAGGSLTSDVPTLKVRFLDADGGKQGSLLSAAIGTRIPEPDTYALLLAGLASLALAIRRKRRPEVAVA